MKRFLILFFPYNHALVITWYIDSICLELINFALKCLDIYFTRNLGFFCYAKSFSAIIHETFLCVPRARTSGNVFYKSRSSCRVAITCSSLKSQIWVEKKFDFLMAWWLQIELVILWTTEGPFSCDASDNQMDIFEGKPPKNLDFILQKWEIIINILNTTLQQEKTKRVKSNIFHVIIVAI